MFFYVYINALFVLCSIHDQSEAAKNSVAIGGIFSPEAKSLEIEAFRMAINSVNDDFSLLKDITLTGLIEKALPDDEFANMEKAISLAQKGAVAIIGPQSLTGFEATQRLCKQLDVAQVAIQASGLSAFISPCNNEHILCMSPGDLRQLRGIAAFIKHFRWKRVAVVASNDKSAKEGIKDFQNHLEANDITVTAVEYFNLPFTAKGYNYINPSLQSKLIRVHQSEAIVVVLKCEAGQAEKIMEEAWRLGLAEHKAWILTDSAVTKDLSRKSFPEYMRGLIGFRQSVGRGLFSGFVRSLWQRSGNKEAITVHTNGFMNFLSFNSKAFSSQAIYDVINYQGNELKTVGNWSNTDGLQLNQQAIIWPSNTTDVPRQIFNTLKNKNITVVTFVGSPFSMLKSNAASSSSEFEGAAIDLLDELSRILGFTYTIYLSPDRKVGLENPFTGEWNGVIKELIDKKADLAVGPITINPAREKAVSFTKPFMNSGLGAVMAFEDSPVQYFRFLSPFHFNLWRIIIISIFGMAVVNWIFSRLSPFGYYGRCAQARRKVKKPFLETKNNLSFLNSLWSSAAYYLGQGPDGNHPVSASGRVSVAVWWFCITILGATYTANLAAYLTTNRLQTPIQSVRDLSQQTSTEYGVVKESQTQRFFATSVIPRYQIMWEFMKLHQSLQSSTSEGLRRVGTGKFAFIHDHPILLYKSRKDYCGKMKVLDGTFGEVHYGFALPTNSPYTTPLSVELLELRNKGEVSRIIDKWMIKKTPCKPLDEAENMETSDTSRMGVFNMLGVFIFMLTGAVVGGVILIIEWIIAVVKDINIWNSQAPHTFSSALSKRLLASCNTSKRVVFVKPTASYDSKPTLSSSKLEYKLNTGKHGSTEL